MNQREVALKCELENIANAKRFDRERFLSDTDFADWVQSRARHTIATLPASAEPAPEPFCWYTVTRTISDEYETVYSEDGEKPKGGGDWKPLYAAPQKPQPAPGAEGVVVSREQDFIEAFRREYVAVDEHGNLKHHGTEQIALAAYRAMLSAAPARAEAQQSAPDAQWCMDAFWRVNPGRNATVPSLYLLDFAREVLRVYGAHPIPATLPTTPPVTGPGNRGNAP